MRRDWRAALVVALLAALPQGAGALDIGELMARLRQVESSRVAFEEIKYLATLTAPLVRRGTLHYERPDRLEMRVNTPFYERMVIVGNTLTIESRRGTRVVDLEAQPGAAAWVAGIRATLAGDGATLARHFDLRVSGSAGRWTLVLEPFDTSLASLIRRITIDGADARLASIEIEERLGDRTVLRVQPADDGKR